MLQCFTVKKRIFCKNLTLSQVTGSHFCQEGVSYYQTVSADWITGTGVSITVTTSAGAKMRAAGNSFKTGRAHLTGQA